MAEPHFLVISLSQMIAIAYNMAAAMERRRNLRTEFIGTMSELPLSRQQGQLHLKFSPHQSACYQPRYLPTSQDSYRTQSEWLPHGQQYLATLRNKWIRSRKVLDCSSQPQDTSHHDVSRETDVSPSSLPWEGPLLRKYCYCAAYALWSLRPLGANKCYPTKIVDGGIIFFNTLRIW